MLKPTYKKLGDHNPVMTQRFGADPYALVYDGRVYLYMTGDEFMYDEQGLVRENDYSNIYKINVISSADLVNWTDHGCVYASSGQGLAAWGDNAWAPAAAYREIDGRMKFFLYFANGGNGIAVLSADSPVGPFVDPIGGPLISREKTRTCAEVTWLFDPAVLMDDDGEAYIYFGGGVPAPEMAALPGTARVAKLGKDMISLDGDPVVIENVSYLFEDSGINKVGDRYIYTYCSNFSVPEEAARKQGFGCGEIIAMEGRSPMGPFTRMGSILKNPEDFFGQGGNNHHCMFCFKDHWYMAYHARILEEAMGILKGYRSTNIDEVTIENGVISPITGTRAGVAQTGYFNPFEAVPAATMATMGGIETVPFTENGTEVAGEMLVHAAEKGCWLGLERVDFGAAGVTRLILQLEENSHGEIAVRTDAADGAEIARLHVDAGMREISCEVKQVLGVHDLYFVFETGDILLKTWQFVSN